MNIRERRIRVLMLARTLVEYAVVRRRFDAAYYLAENADVRAAVENGAIRSPVLHYLRHGWREGRDPSPGFSTTRYLDAHRDVRESGINPYYHYLRFGMAEGRESTPRSVEPSIELPSYQPTDTPNPWEARERLIPWLRPATAPVGPRDPDALGFCVSLAGGDLASEAARTALPTTPGSGAVDVSIVIMHTGSSVFALECISSISRVAGDGFTFEVIVFDNDIAAGDDVIALVPRVSLVRSTTRLPPWRARVAASASARGRYLMFLHADTQIAPESVSALLKAMRGDLEGIGMAGPKVLSFDGRLEEAGSSIQAGLSVERVGRGADHRAPRFNYWRDVECVSGTSFLVERACFDTVEVSDLDSDDLTAADLCLGLHRAGRRVVYVPDAVVAHHPHESRRGSAERHWEPDAARDRHSFAGKWQADLVAPDVRLLAFYLPQYHPIPQNDRAWGPGFTEWRNVTRARPNYAGHRQPRVPADLGYYDLRVPEIMDAQAELARRYGLTGFCYYYYWFGGTRLLEMPLERLLATGRPNVPFCLCWANENWTRRWDGGDSDVIMAQDYSDDDAVAIIADMSRYLGSQDYIRVNGKPLILVYRVNDLPSFKRTSDVWRRYRRTHGLGDISIGMVESFELATEQEDPARYGCDFAVEFPTHEMHTVASVAVQDRSAAFRGSIYDYEELVLRYSAKAEPPFKRLRTVLSGWDNTPRRQADSIVLERDTPGAFQAWLEWTIRRTREQNYGDERIVFINAWNEWCEGAYLEPDMEYGHDRLQAIANAIEVTRR
jgi:hypothetical protein